MFLFRHSEHDGRRVWCDIENNSVEMFPYRFLQVIRHNICFALTNEWKCAIKNLICRQQACDALRPVEES